VECFLLTKIENKGENRTDVCSNAKKLKEPETKGKHASTPKQ